MKLTNRNTELLLVAIEEYRSELVKNATELGLLHPTTIKLSTHLDALLNKLEREKNS